MNRDQKLGIFYGALSYIIWGFSPLYFKALHNISSPEILAHRILWSAIFVQIYLVLRKQLSKLIRLVSDNKLIGILIISSILISSNWLIYIYAIATQRTIDSSLGYFINPILIVFLGVFFLGEKLSRIQILSLCFAVVGLLHELIMRGGISWISISLPITFGTWGLIRKKANIGSVEGLAIETLLLVPLAFSYMIYLDLNHELAFSNVSFSFKVFISFAGIITTMPLLLFVEGSKRLPFSWMGFLQYINPTLQLLIGIYIFHEPFDGHRLVSFAFVWIGLAILASNQVLKRTRRSNI